jgi:hypothetical protein
MRFVPQRAAGRNPRAARCSGRGCSVVCRRAAQRPEISQQATTAHDGLRVAYLGGALVELAGALIALFFIRDDSMEQRKR